MTYTGAAIIIPTRNRASIAMNAVRSVLDQRVKNVHVMVSDNSTSDTEREALADFCATTGDERLRYAQPPEPLPMPEHWDWAIHDALNTYKQASHFLYLTDRMMFRKDALKELVDLASRFPDKLISYKHDRIIDNVSPIRVEQYPATEKFLEVETLRLSRLLSQAVIHPAVPRMLNCIVPRSVLNRIDERFGNVFSSICPDFNFCCRCIETEDSILFYDKALGVHYAMLRSNGASLARGEITADNADFNANLPVDRSMANFATPIPQLNTAVNYALHEYCLFKQQTNSAKFFELDMQKYLQANASEIAEIVDPALRARMFALVVESGYRDTGTKGVNGAANATFRERLQSKIKRTATAPATTPVWLFLARTLALTPPGQNYFEFATIEAAIDYARNTSRGNFRPSLRDEMLQAREMPKQ